ncbi:MAG: DUF6298 domain-containing protein [Phycisphaerae bacterium]|nr:DUF6298 domain-containing protein [Phycisphaerae bacterium]
MTTRPASWLVGGAAALVLLISAAQAQEATPSTGKTARAVSEGSDGKLAYAADAQGNRIVDFSHCGYAGGERDIPDAPIRVVVPPAAGDAGARIQAALDYVASLPPDADGLRGAVLLGKGRYEVGGQLLIRASGVVLRGSGMGTDGTVLVAAGLDRRTLIRIVGAPDRTEAAPIRKITDTLVPVGATKLSLDNTEGLKVGDAVLVRRPSTAEWIDALGTGENPWRDWRLNWKPGSRDIVWDRTVTAIDGHTITVDAPITTAIEKRFGGGTVTAYTWPGRISQVGAENLRCESAFDTAKAKDENHSWVAITMDNAQDAWVRQAAFVHFAGGAVAVGDGCKQVTVQDCLSSAPVSEIGGYRRHTFFTRGQQTLFLRCSSEQGRHDFAVGHCAAGPNAFVYCEAREALDSSGPIEDWAGGVLYDNVVIDGNCLVLSHRGLHGERYGWSAANCVLWNCHAARIEFLTPPTAGGWAFGSWAECFGNAVWEANNDFVSPRSLYQAQLAQRVGESAGRRVGDGPQYPPGGTSPTYEQAAKAAAASNAPAQTVADLVKQSAARRIPTDPGAAPTVEQVIKQHPELLPKADRPAGKKLALVNGWLVCDGKLLTGGRTGTVWWRGDITPAEAAQAADAVTRFVPGRVGRGYTDDLGEMTDRMVAKGWAVLDYHYALWHERRRDDHQRVRRADGNVWPPFYELPFARSGVGAAWDGLSKYDLTKYNPWYWMRLRQFADLAEQKGLVLLYQNYFQHNILEAGAHWADFPWRSANNINDTGFPEPPPYASNKRIFQAHLFYDTTHPVRRPLHEAYIRKCLDAFADNSNVIQSTSAEFTGPVEFVRFWLDTIASWQKQTRKDALVALSCTKDVQDAILADPPRSKIVDVIDIRYWHYQADGTPYAPAGGKNLAPRQHARQLRPRPSSFEQVVRAVREYRTKFPDKAVIYSGDGLEHGWAVLMGGGSLPDIRAKLDPQLLAAIARMTPAELVSGDQQSPTLHSLGDGAWCLAEAGANYLVYSSDGKPITLDLGTAKGEFAVRWIDPASGKMTAAGPVTGGQTVSLQPPSPGPCAVWLARADKAR